MKIQNIIITISTFLFLSFAANAQSHEPHKPADLSKPNFVETHNDGTVKQTGFVIKNKNEGNWKQYHQNNELAIEGNYASGKKTGEWKYYDQNGTLTGKVLWVRNKALYKEVIEPGAVAKQVE